MIERVGIQITSTNLLAAWGATEASPGVAVSGLIKARSYQRKGKLGFSSA